MPIDYRSAIIDQTAAMVEIVRTTPHDVRVSGCPDWNLGELAVHMGGVQRWATEIITTGQPVRLLSAPADGEDLADFLAAGVGPLVAVLDAADLDAPLWNFTGLNQTKAFWLRRQALEVTIHRWDADSCAGSPPPLPADLAADAIDEFLHLMIPRILHRTKADLSTISGDVHVHCTDVAGEWTFDVVDGAVRVQHGHGKATTAIKGTASDLALFLFNRIEQDAVEIFGDHDLLQSWQGILRF